jgi:hypothetical protein
MKDNIWIIFVAIEFFFRGKWFHGADLPKRKERRILQAWLATPDLASKRTDWFMMIGDAGRYCGKSSMLTTHAVIVN